MSKEEKDKIKKHHDECECDSDCHCEDDNCECDCEEHCCHEEVEEVELVKPEAETTTKKKKETNKDKVEELTKKVKELSDKNQRIQAESINYKKRVQADTLLTTKYAKQELISQLMTNLELLNNVASIPQEDPKFASFLQGFKMISDNLFKTLYDDGLSEIKSLNTKFDPRYHYILSKEKHLEIPDLQVIKEVQKGYMYKDRVLQVAKVIINDTKMIDVYGVELSLNKDIIEDIQLYDKNAEVIKFDISEIKGKEYREKGFKDILAIKGFNLGSDVQFKINNK